MKFSEIVQSRRSVKQYDPDHVISDAVLKEIFEEVRLSPSSFNLQHSIFICVQDEETQKKLCEAAWNQQQVKDCSAAIVVCGRLDAFEDAGAMWQTSPQEVQDFMIPNAMNFYEGKDQICRDEAIRSASLAAMTLMYSARARGYDTGPMIGFDPVAVSRIVELPTDCIPVMLVVLGMAKGEPKPRPYRRPVSEVVRRNSFKGPGLE